MPVISLICAMDEQNGLGYKNQLLCYQPADLQHFKKITWGKPIIMGRNTFSSIGKPLPGRKNIVLTSTHSFIEGVTCCTSLKEACDQLQDAEEIMIIGGAQVYKEAIAFASKLYVTRIHHRFTADVFFPPIDSNDWHCISQDFYSHDEKNKYDMTFFCYEKRICE